MPQPENDIRDLKAIPILDVAARLGLLAANGRQARCFRTENHSHGDRRPSLHLNPTKNRFKCFVCPDTFGDVIDLVRLSLRVDFGEACDWLRRGSFVAAETHHRANAVSPRLDREIYEGFYSLLESASPLLNRFCEERGISVRVCQRTGTRVLGQYDAVQTALLRWFGADRVRRAGLTNDKGHLIFYRHRIIFPWKEDHNVPTYFTARAVGNAGDGPKELCLAGLAPILPYNAPAVAAGQEIHICEGVPDTLTLEDMDHRAIGTGGTEGLRPSWMDWLKQKGVKKVIPAFDADPAGEAKARVVEQMALALGLPVGRLFLPRGHDVNSYFGRGPAKKAA